MPSNLARLIVLLAALSGLAAPPVAAQSADQWFLAEGASNAVLEEEILIANPSSSSVTVTVTLLPDPSAVIAPGTELSQAFALGPTSRLTVRVGEAFSGLNGAASARVSAVVAGTTTPADIVVERSMYFPDGTRVGAHNASGVTEPAQRFVAEGNGLGIVDRRAERAQRSHVGLVPRAHRRLEVVAQPLAERRGAHA